MPVIPTLMGWGTIPDDHPLMAGMVGLQTATATATQLARVRLRVRHRQPLGQPAHRLGRDLHARPEIRARRHRADADRPGVRPRLRHRLGRGGGARTVRRPRREWHGRAAKGPRRLGARVPGTQAHHAAQHPLRRGAGQAAARVRGDEPGLRPRHLLRQHDRPVADRGRAVPARLRAARLDQLRPGRAAGLDHSGGARRRAADPGRQVVALSGDYDFQFLIEELAVGRSSSCPTSTWW